MARNDLFENECSAVVCHNKPTVTLDLTIRMGDKGKTFDQEIPYCDEHIGWFYRSFSRPSYRATVRGITILISADEEFGLTSN